MLLSLIYREKYMCWTRNKEDSNVVADIVEYVLFDDEFLLYMQDKYARC